MMKLSFSLSVSQLCKSGMGQPLFPGNRDRTRGHGLHLHQGRFRLDIPKANGPFCPQFPYPAPSLLTVRSQTRRKNLGSSPPRKSIPSHSHGTALGPGQKPSPTFYSSFCSLSEVDRDEEKYQPAAQSLPLPFPCPCGSFTS